MTNACLPWETLERYATGAAADEQRAVVEAHASTCDTCRLSLAAAGLAFTPGSVEEEALVAWMASSRPVEALLADLGVVAAGSQPEPVPGRRSERPLAEVLRPKWGGRRWRTAAGGLVAALAASLALTFVLPDSGSSLPHRALQGRPAQLHEYTPFVATRGAVPEELWTELEVESRESGPEAAVAVLLSRGGQGDWERAESLLHRAPRTAARENDRGVLLLAAGRAPEALAAFDDALGLDRDLTAAWFNRALALEALGRGTEARAAWQAYLDRARGDDSGWLDEARSHLAD